MYEVKITVKGLLVFFLFIGGCRILGPNNESLHITPKDPIHFSITDLDFVKEELKNEGNIYQEAYNNLIIKANKALNSYGYSVVTKEGSAPNGDKHEYVSRGRYWWPNPDTDNGLPYIKRDGKTNPEIYQFDRTSLSNLKNDIKVLSIAFYLTANDKYSKKAISLLDKWFIDSETKMKPNLQFAQGIPGRHPGRAVGIIDGLDFYRILNYISILQNSKHWTNKTSEGISNWYYNYYTWLLNHHFGKAEKNTKNNHGTWYDVQIATYAYFLNEDRKLKEVLSRVRTKRIPEQIESNGRQPQEISRTQSLHYSTYNLRAFSILAKLSYKTQVDLAAISTNTSKNIWNYSSNKSGSVENALRFLLPFIKGERTWNYDQISKYNSCSLLPILKHAYDYFKKEDYNNIYYSIIDKNPSCKKDINMILYPPIR